MADFEDMTLKEVREHLAGGGSFVHEGEAGRFEVREDRAFGDEEFYCLAMWRPGSRTFSGTSGFANVPQMLGAYAPLASWEAVPPEGT